MHRRIEGKTFYDKPWYNSYRAMMSRCYKPKDASYKRYGERGIKVCDEWHNIENFEKWVDANPWFDGATIDRIDTMGNYNPSNCRWASKKTQARNRSSCVYVTHFGKTHTLSEWAELTGINRSTIINRYWRGIRPPELFDTHMCYSDGKSPCHGKHWYIDERGKRRWETGT